MSVLERMQEPTPKFFRVLRTIGLSLVAAGGAVVATPISVPAVVVTIAGYVTVAGFVMTAVSQAAVEKLEQ
jgi:hypothetical protein